eukprot:CAMPEP_0177749406 /NCGR_PEP_ID=MMETSP0484_2-20121128/32469_1 /TAXON_ID=354590 /ORGANISM="Rhodomonas lens, Strain RHODO" /LENGTH=306 /DNA_ID=CAMNT_0019264387 /DNA_START=11 /DNA_END=927 /DNA_ORIENTATION=-
MADRKATNRYYPPEFWDQKNFSDKSNLNSYRGESWRNRGAQVNSKLLTQGRNVVRFEMPFDIFCEKCNECIHKGVRFNADKEKAGKYFSTTIWEFDMKCHLCDNRFIMKTDPEHTTFVCHSGCRQKQETWEDDQDTEKVPDAKEKRKLENDPFYRLEHFAATDGSGRREDEVRKKTGNAQIADLRAVQDVRSRDDGMLNRMLRKGFREDKKESKRKQEEDLAERRRFNLEIPLLPPAESDAVQAREQMFAARVEGEEERYRRAGREGLKKVLRAPILPRAESHKQLSTLQRVHLLAMQRSKQSGGV